MARVYIDCREMASEVGCTLALSADSQEELLEAAAAVHGHTDDADLRTGLAGVVHEGAPSA